jgi:hypothetical protein
MSDIPQTLGPVAKLQYLRQAAAMPNLNRVQLAVLVVLADMANATHGLAWPSFSTLAASTGTSTRHAKTATKGLIEAGLIVVHEPGTRVRSNRYKLNPKPPVNTQGSDPQDTTQGSDLQDTTVVIPSNISGDPQSTKVVIPRTPKSINQSEQQAKIDDRATGEGAAAPSRPGGPSGLHPPEPKTNQDRYPEFWQAMPMKTTVHDAEARITEYLDNGEPFAEIVAGAKRYTAYCQATKSPRRQSALAWLNRQAWRDDWTAPTTKTPAKATDSPQAARKAKGKGNATAKAKEARRVNPEYVAWQSKHDPIRNSYSANYKSFENHLYTEGTPYIYHCKPCMTTRNDLLHKRPASAAFCEIGKPLYEHLQGQKRQVAALERSKPNKYLPA